MAAVGRSSSEDVRRGALSPKPKGRENSKDTLCRNVTIYGHCRYEGKGCAFNHDPVKVNAPQIQTDNTKKRFNVDSPSFTPSLTVNGSGTKASGLSPKAASAAPFKPKGSNTGPRPYNPAAPDWSSSIAPASTPEIPEFLPQSHSAVPSMGETNGSLHQAMFDPYVNSSTPLPIATHTTQPPPPLNPYSQDTTASGGASYYQNSSYAQPLQYHLYAPLGPHREGVLPYQRLGNDFFISDTLREDLQRKSAASLQTLPNSTLPPQIDYFHSLVPLDTSNQKNAALFGYPSWIYKAISSKDGNIYALRRLEGYRLTNEKAIRSVHGWKRVSNGNVVTVIDAFTNRSFGDSSLMFVTDYHPLSKTLAEQHFSSNSRFANRGQGTIVTEQTLWSYMVQIANALKAIHSTGLAARIIDPTKIIVTSKNRLRLNACAILDVVQHDSPRTLIDLQREDLLQFGRLLLAVGTNNPSVIHNVPKAMEQLARSYSPQLKDRVFWLLGMITPNKTESIDTFINGIAPYVMSSFDSTLHLNDQLNSELNRELENARIVRLLTKINFINERPDYNHDRQWSETGERFPIKLFRDYVFHQVGANGNPVLDLGHVIGCLNKLDVGSDEKMVLSDRAEQICIVVSFKEMKRAVEGAYQDLVKASRKAM